MANLIAARFSGVCSNDAGPATANGDWGRLATETFSNQTVSVLNFAVRLSRASVQMRTLAQELALVRARLDAVEESREG